MEYLIVFTTGAVGYTALEILWRGYSHWTMELLGGVCFLIVYLTEKHRGDMTLVKKCSISCAVITTLELLCGILVNRVFNMDVWDYSEIPFNFMGQICIAYSAIWFMLSAVLFFLCRYMLKLLTEKQRILS